MKTALSEFYEALRAKASISVVEEIKRPNQVKILARLLDGNRAPQWKVIRHRMKVAEFDAPWSWDCSKVDLLKGNTKHGPLVYAWRIIVAHVDLDTALREVTKVIRNAPNARVELQEVVLPGGGQHRNIDSSGGKGASYTSGSKGSGPRVDLIQR